MAELLDFDKDDSAQSLLELWGLAEPYEDVIARSSLNVLRQSDPLCEIESIRFVLSAGFHPEFRAGGTKVPENADRIVLQELTLPFALEIHVRCGSWRDLLKATFVFECSGLDVEPRTELRLDIHGQWDLDADGTGSTA